MAVDPDKICSSFASIIIVAGDCRHENAGETSDNSLVEVRSGRLVPAEPLQMASGGARKRPKTESRNHYAEKTMTASVPKRATTAKGVKEENTDEDESKAAVATLPSTYSSPLGPWLPVEKPK